MNLEHVLEIANALLALMLVGLVAARWQQITLRLQRRAVVFLALAMVCFTSREIIVLLPMSGSGLRLAREITETLTILLTLFSAWTVLRSQQQEIQPTQEEAERDALTGLLNRRYFIRHAAKILEYWEDGATGRPWLMMLDVDDFKAYNDAYGHEAGDVALRRIASAIRASVRHTDLVARYGGEEFIALIIGSEEAPHAVVERLQANTQRLCQPDHELRRALTLSIGVAAWSPERATLEALIHAADRALYRAKWGGKNQACFYDPRLDAEYIVHICHREAWEAAQQAGAYRPPSLDEVGFIHCSRPDQLHRVVDRFFPQTEGLVLLWVDPTRVTSPIRWEYADEEEFPHIYGPLNLEAVNRVTPLEAWLNET